MADRYKNVLNFTVHQVNANDARKTGCSHAKEWPPLQKLSKNVFETKM